MINYSNSAKVSIAPNSPQAKINPLMLQKNSTMKTYIKNSCISITPTLPPTNEQINNPYNINILQSASATIEEKIILNPTAHANVKKKGYSTTLTFKTHKSIIAFYERDLKFSLKKEQEYLSFLQKEQISLKNEEDFEILKKILIKSEKTRDKNEMAFLKRACEQLQYFQDLKENIDDHSYEECFIHLKYESLGKNKFLFRIGELGKKIYLILKGEVIILIPNQNSPENDEISNDSQTPSQRKSMESTKAFDNLMPNQIYVRNYQQGEVFGDGSLNIRGERFIFILLSEICVKMYF